MKAVIEFDIPWDDNVEDCQFNYGEVHEVLRQCYGKILDQMARRVSGAGILVCKAPERIDNVYDSQGRRIGTVKVKCCPGDAKRIRRAKEPKYNE